MIFIRSNFDRHIVLGYYQNGLTWYRGNVTTRSGNVVSRDISIEHWQYMGNDCLCKIIWKGSNSKKSSKNGNAGATVNPIGSHNVYL